MYAESNGTYGSPRLHVELNDAGFTCGRANVARVMHLADLNGCPKRTGRHVESQVGLTLLSDDQQNHKGNEIENHKDDLEHHEARVNDHIEGLSRHGEPLGVPAIYDICGKHEEKRRRNQDAGIYYCAPHEEICECRNTHDVLRHLFLSPSLSSICLC